MVNQQQYPVLITDIGGTNTRFGMLNDSRAKLQILKSVKTGDFEDFQSAVRDCLGVQNTTRPAQLLIGAAGVISKDAGDECRLTNGGWRIKPVELIAEFGFSQVEIMNDFSAQALGVLAIDRDEMREIPSAHKNANYDNDDTFETRLVLGPGTGFGIAILIYVANRWVVLPSEGAAADLGLGTGLNWQREREIIPFLKKRNERLTIDSLISGPGLETLFEAIALLNADKPGGLNAAQISNSDQPTAREAVALFSSLLGRVSGNLALSVMAKGGVYVTGGMANKMFDQIVHSDFRTEFDHKAPHDKLVRAMRTFFVNREFAALEGLAYYAGNRDQFDLSRAVVKFSA